MSHLGNIWAYAQLPIIKSLGGNLPASIISKRFLHGTVWQGLWGTWSPQGSGPPTVPWIGCSVHLSSRLYLCACMRTHVCQSFKSLSHQSRHVLSSFILEHMHLRQHQGPSNKSKEARSANKLTHNLYLCGGSPHHPTHQRCGRQMLHRNHNHIRPAAVLISGNGVVIAPWYASLLPGAPWVCSLWTHQSHHGGSFQVLHNGEMVRHNIPQWPKIWSLALSAIRGGAQGVSMYMYIYSEAEGHADLEP